MARVFTIESITVSADRHGSISAKATFADGWKVRINCRDGALEAWRAGVWPIRPVTSAGRLDAIRAALPEARRRFSTEQRKAAIRERLADAAREREEKAKSEADEARQAEEDEAERLAGLTEDERQVEELCALRAAIGPAMADMFA